MYAKEEQLMHDAVALTTHPHRLPFPSCAERVADNNQRRRELHALYSLDYWDVELVEDEQWGRVLVAQRDFTPGEIVIRSGALLDARTVADCVRRYREYPWRNPINSHITAQYIQWATSSSRFAA
jgi:hypothetical protein